MKKRQDNTQTRLILILIGIIVVLGGFAISQTFSHFLPSSEETPDYSEDYFTYYRSTVVPKSWKHYSDAKFPVSFSYPASWHVSPNSKGNSALFTYEIGIGSSSQSYDALVGVSKLPLAKAVERFTANSMFTDDGAIVLKNKFIVIDGNSAREVRYEQNVPGKRLIERQYFVHRGDYTYELPVVYEYNRPNLSAKDSLTLFESFRIK